MSRSCPGCSSNGTWMAAHWSSPVPALPDRRTRRSAAGCARLPLRPMNSLRSQVMERMLASVLKKPTRPENSVL
ncbi:hypothetical protein D3C81_2030790 [compost metagenome]